MKFEWRGVPVRKLGRVGYETGTSVLLETIIYFICQF